MILSPWLQPSSQQKNGLDVLIFPILRTYVVAYFFMFDAKTYKKKKQKQLAPINTKFGRVHLCIKRNTRWDQSSYMQNQLLFAICERIFDE